MFKFLCRAIPAGFDARCAFKVLAGVCLAMTLAFSVATSLPHEALAEEDGATVSEEPTMVDSSSEGGGIVPR